MQKERDLNSVKDELLQSHKQGIEQNEQALSSIELLLDLLQSLDSNQL